ncbi:MAG TPA: hypothetical protein V6D22_13690 [Candidatus Obscuribacterales bacterium]
MTVPNTNYMNSYTGDGVTTQFSYTWNITESQMLAVYVNNVLQVQGTDYSYTTNINTSQVGGNITFSSVYNGVSHVAGPPANGANIQIIRQSNQLQSNNLNNNQAMPPSTVMAMIDKLTMLVQDALRYYLSPATTFAAGTLYTLPHKLGYVPTRLQYLLICTVAEAGYSVGDTIDITPQFNALGAAQVDMTNIYVRTLSALGAINVPHKTTFASTALTLPANWQLQVAADVT